MGERERERVRGVIGSGSKKEREREVIIRIGKKIRYIRGQRRDHEL